MDKIAIKVENLSKTYKLYDQPMDRLKESLHPLRKKYHKDFYAVKDVSFEVKKGETVGIIGKNGSGKSTLLKMITGVLTPTSGSIQANGKISALLELGAGFNPEYTGMENIFLNGTIMGYTKEEMDQRVQSILDFADIGEFIHQPVKTYSSGMFVRLAFAVAINVEPEILIVDEALAVGDALFQRKCFAKFEDFKKSGKTILFVSHEGGTIIEFCNRVLLIDEGAKLIFGDSSKVVNLYHKLLYAPKNKQEELKTHISFFEQMNKNGMQKNNEKFQSKMIDQLLEDEKLDLLIELDEEEYMDSSLCNQSVIEYESRGARIIEAEVTTLEGKKVNVLNSGKKYIWKYKVEFYNKCHDIRFGMLIKTVSGLELGGAVTAQLLGGISLVKKGEKYNVEFKFTPKLAQGVYFLNCGVLGIEDGNEVYIDRKIDVYAFKVLERKKSLITSIFDFNVEPKAFLVKD